MIFPATRDDELDATDFILSQLDGEYPYPFKSFFRANIVDFGMA